jgi:hypothetical protein
LWLLVEVAVQENCLQMQVAVVAVLVVIEQAQHL